MQCEDQNSAGDCALQTQTAYDGLGRLAVNVKMENPSQAIRVDTTYDALGRVASRTNPSRPGDGLNFQTTYSYDALGRVTQVRTADGAIATTTYNGNSTTVADQANNAKLYTYDALGRLTAVIEDPGGLNYGTNYFYDTQNNLIAAYQGYCPACQGRWFAYDSLSRLTQAASYESGNTNYGYDAAGNLVTKTDARGVTTTYSYDPLNRLTSKSYNDGTPAVTYAYDDANVAYAKGRLTRISNANSTTNYSAYDLLGRVKASNEQTAGQTYPFSYSYNLAGGLTSETYPSGRVVSTSYDRVNRVSSVTGSLNGQTANYITETAYWPHGGIYYYVRGNHLWYAVSYNSRLQQTESYEAINNSSDLMLLVACPNWGVNSNAGVYDICPHASATNDNGNLQSVVTYAGGPGPASALTSFSGSFFYDGVNRLTSASESGDWWRNFGYDQYGNMWVTGNGGAPLAGNTPTSNVYSGNRMVGASYDAAGNQLVVNGDTLSYDAENRQTSAQEDPVLGGATETYSYDGNGQRVAKSGPAGTTVHVYDAFGQLAAEYSTAAAPAPPPCTPCYLSYDHLGSLRMVTDINGNVVARHDYLPFGEEIPGGWAGRGTLWGIPDEVNQKFTGQERDTETGMDFFHARYFGAALGRFTSVDPGNAGADIANPQSWNAYAYVLGNPLALVDPSGLGSVTDPPPIPLPCPQCVVNVPGEPSDPITTDPCFYFTCLGGGGGATEQPPPQPPPVFTVTVIANPPKTGTQQTFGQCMAAHANDFSILGAFNAGTNALFNRQDTYKNNVFLGALGGNSITSLIYGSTADAAGTGVTLAPTIVTAAMGTVTSYGRRTSTIMALNLAGKGGLPLALGASSAGAKSAIDWAGKRVLGLGLDFQVKLGIDAAAGAAEAAYCYSQTQ